MRPRLGLALVALVTALPATAQATPPAPLSRDPATVDIASTRGGGVFGSWRTDDFGLPSYRYTVDELHDARARQPELGGNTDAWQQVGHDHIGAAASNHGYTQLWSQDRRYQWTNRYDAATQHFAGGYGYLKVGNRVLSTLYDDRVPGSASLREYGVGYFRHAITFAGLAVNEHVYAPFGDDPLLLHDVTIRNDTSRVQRVSWFEYWDANPFDQATKSQVGLGPVRWLAGAHALEAEQLPTTLDRRPLTIFAAALRGPLAGHSGDARAFFGAGSRAVPAAVAAGGLSAALAPATPSGSVGHSMFAFRAPVMLAPHRSITLRYAYGAAHASQLPSLLRSYARPASPLHTSERRWRAWLPQIMLGRGRSWLSRELQWDAYMVRSGATYEDCRGRHVISQGGYYQYDIGFQGAYRDPLQHILPIIYADPPLARDVLLYSAQEQPRVGGQVPYAMTELCHPLNLGNADDLDLWLMLAASEYGLGTRDMRLFDTAVGFADSGSGTLWAHLKLAYRHQESLLGPHGGYRSLDTGDWSDFSSTFLQMNESMLVTAQAAYIYPRLAALAEARGDRAFALQLRGSAARDLRTMRGQWTPRGWYTRGYAGKRQIGTGAIFGEPQPWAILAGAPNRAQAGTLTHQVRRFLTGVGAPVRVHGPARIGSSQSPAANDPAVIEHSHPTVDSTGDNGAVFIGGSWYAINGWLTWALGTLGDSVPHAREYAFSELQRNTLTAHAVAYPAHWDGITSVDDVCRSFYSSNADICGASLTRSYEGQIIHQPAWSLFDAIRLAGITPSASGFQIKPELPVGSFSLRLPEIGVAYQTALARGYVVSSSSGTLTMEVTPPSSGRWQAYAGSRRARVSRRGGVVVFQLPVRAGRAADWAVVRG